MGGDFEGDEIYRGLWGIGGKYGWGKIN